MPVKKGCHRRTAKTLQINRQIPLSAPVKNLYFVNQPYSTSCS